MIVPMKSLTLLCLASEREATLEALREWGVLHLVSVRAPEGKDVEQARARRANVKRALDALPENEGTASSGEPADLMVERILGVLDETRKCREERESLLQERARLAPYGTFDPQAIAALAKKGVHVRLFHANAGHRVDAPDGVAIQILREDKSGVYFAAIGREPISLDAHEFRMPELPLSELDRRLGDLDARIAASEKLLQQRAGDAGLLKKYALDAEDAVRFLEAREGMGTEASLAYLRGFCPADSVEALRASAARHGWGLVLSEPEGDEVPTLIRNPRWVQPIKAVLDFMGVLPGYREIDTNAAFLLFLSIFFAIIVGDAGYGLIFMGLTFAARRKMPKAPAYPFRLLYIMSFCTVLWGTVTGTWFGAGALPTFLNDMTVAWLKDGNNIMFLSFLLGAIHLTLAHLWNAMRIWNSPRMLAQLGWIGSTWTMFFVACSFVLGQPMPGWLAPLFIVSVVLIVLFMTAPRDLKGEWFNHVMLPLNLVSNFVDLVSYIRLFAVGAASYTVANSFNTMILAGGVKGIVAGLIAALLLFAGHALNILLCVMGVLVHGVRLITLEFSSHSGISWAGFAYKPFRRLDAEQTAED